MFNKILVPLDGSKLAECALEYAIELAQKTGAESVTLVSVTEIVKGTSYYPESSEVYHSSQKPGLSSTIDPAASFGKGTSPVRLDSYGAVINPVTSTKPMQAITFGKMEKQAQKYMQKIAKQFTAKNIKCNVQVLIGPVADEIAKFVNDNEIDCVVMSSHGRSGISKWARGSVTDKILSAVCVPIMVVRAPGCFASL